MINYQIDKNTHKELLLLYKELLVNTSEFLKEDLELNTISKICASYTYMYENGYLSFNHNFVFSDYYAKMLGYNNFDIFGLIIITGTGICRNITPFLTDLLNTMNYNCYNMSLDNVGRFLNKEKTLLIYTKLFPKLLGTHMINYIKNGNENIVFDAIDNNNHFPELVDKRIVKYNYEDNRYIAWFINELNKGVFMPSLRKQGNSINIKEYKSTIEFLNKNKDILESFFSNNKDLYYEVYIKLENEIQKELSFYNSFKVKLRYK